MTLKTKTIRRNIKMIGNKIKKNNKNKNDVSLYGNSNELTKHYINIL